MFGNRQWVFLVRGCGGRDHFPLYCSIASRLGDDRFAPEGADVNPFLFFERAGNVIRSFLRSLRLLSRRHKIIFFGLLLIRVAINFLDIFGLMAIGVLGTMLVSGFSERPSATFVGITIDIESSQTYFWVVVVISGFFLGKSLLGIVLLRVSSLFFARMESKISSEIADFLYSGTLTRLRGFSRGDVHFAIGTSPTVAMSGLLLAGSSIVTESALFLSILAVFLFVDPVTGLIISGYFILLVVIFQLGINRRLRLIGQRLSTSAIAMANNIQDMTNSFREIAVFSKQPFFLRNYYHRRRQFALDNALLGFFSGLPRFFVESSLMVGVLALIGYQFLRGNLSDGLVTTVIFLAGGLRLMAALLPIQAAIASVKTFGPQAELAQRLLPEARVWKAQEDERRLNQKDLTEVLSDSRGFAVSVSNLFFTHLDSSEPALKGVSLEVAPGSFVAFVGPSGAGKTTLADLILGINAPDSGRLDISGFEPTGLRELYPGAAAYVPQNPGMVSGTIAENIALGEAREAVDEERVWQSLEKAELAGYVRGLPKGINTDLGAQSDGLSGGQKQRLGLARALYTNPRLLVLDEATSALDAGTEANIATAIRKLGESTTVIVIAHRLSTIQHADKVYVLEDGLITAEGTFKEVRKRVPLIEEYVRLMSIDD
jgi:ATP-binding cassette subfamily C protein